VTLASLMVHDLTVVSPAVVTDRYGNVTKDWTNATRSDVKGWVARSSSNEVTDAGREAQVSDWVAYLPVGTVITGGARVEWSPIGDPLVFEVVGPPLPAMTPRGLHHLEAQLRVVEG